MKKTIIAVISLSLVIFCAIKVNAQTPFITSFTPDSGSIGTPVTITGNNLNSPSSITIGGVTAIVISNTGSALVVMVMPGAKTGTVSVTAGSGIATSSTTFKVIASKIPNTQQGNKLVGTKSAKGGGSGQGMSIALSADGNTAAVGGYRDSSVAGATWVYTRSGRIWTQQGNKLIGTNGSYNAKQGSSVALSADGNTLVVGAPGDNNALGAAWVFTRTSGVWNQQGNKLVNNSLVGYANLGASVAISADGNTIVLGASGDNNIGATLVFTLNGGVWIQLGGKLIGTGGTGPYSDQGASVAISADGNTIIIGNSADNYGAGTAWIFTNNAGVWTQQGNKLNGTGAIGSPNQGNAVAISADGNTALVGGPFDNNRDGAVWVYTRGNGMWSQQGNKLIATDTTGAATFGNAVTLSADGNTAIIGGRGDDSGTGAIWLFNRNGSTWIQAHNKLVGAGAVGSIGNHYVDQGISVAVSADGNTAIEGGERDQPDGAAWIFATPPPPPTISSFSPTNASVGTTVTINGHYFDGSTAVSFGGTHAYSFNVVNDSTITAIVNGGATGSVSVTTFGGTASLNGFIYCKQAVYNSLNLSGCNSVIYNNKVYTTPTVFYDTIKSVQGCDSIYYTVNITINTITPKNTINNQSNCDSIIYKGVVYKSSAVIRDTIKSVKGCDSIYQTVNITINLNVSGGVYHPTKGYTIHAVSTIDNGTFSLNQGTGNYNIHCISATNPHTIKLYKNNDVNKASAITTLDIALVQSHVLQKSLLNNPLKLIAADVNGDGKVSTLDIVYIKRLILGIDTTFTNTVTTQNRLWAFVDSTYKFPDPLNPFPYKDSINFVGLSGNQINQSFIGEKLGDVNWDWNPALARPQINNIDAVELSYPSDAYNVSNEHSNLQVSDGYIRIPIKVKNFKEMLGMQFTISFDASKLQWQGIGNNPLGIETGTNHAGEGNVSFLWVDKENTIKTEEDGSTLMELVFKTIQPFNNETLNLNSSVTAIAAYDKEYNLHGIVMKPSLINLNEIITENWSVSPNPIVGGIIQVGLNLKINKTIVLRVLDNTGKVLMVKQVEGIKGRNIIPFNLQNQLSKGIYYIQAIGIEGETGKKIVVGN